MGESQPQVLVVDDDPIVLVLLEERLSALGYDVTTRDRALGTSSWIVKHKPWLVVLDLEMPALSGQELADFLRSKGLDTPVIIHSGKSEEELKRVVRSTGALGAIRKGVSEAQFAIQFNNLVNAAKAKKSMPARRRSTSASRRETISAAEKAERRSMTGARRIGESEETPTSASGAMGHSGETD